MSIYDNNEIATLDTEMIDAAVEQEELRSNESQKWSHSFSM